MRERDPERLRETPRSARDQALRRPLGEAAQGAHACDPPDRLERAQQHGRSPAAGLAHHVCAGVHAIASVGVKTTWRPEHRAVAPRLAAMGVRARIGSISEIGFHLDDPPGEPCAVGEPVHQQRTHQGPRHLGAGSVEECARKGRAEAHAAPGGSRGVVGGGHRGVIISGPHALRSGRTGSIPRPAGVRDPKMDGEAKPGPTDHEPEAGADERQVSETLSGFGVNAALVEEIRQRYEVDPSSVHASWAEFFEKPDAAEPVAPVGPPPAVEPAAAEAPRVEMVAQVADKHARVLRLIHSYRARGHRIADTDPLGGQSFVLPRARSRPTTASATTISTGPTSPATCRAARCRRCARSSSGCARPTAARSASSSPTSRTPGRKAWLQRRLEESSNATPLHDQRAAAHPREASQRPSSSSASCTPSSWGRSASRWRARSR